MSGLAAGCRAAALALLLGTPGLADIAAVTSQNAGMLSLIDTDGMRLIGSVPLPGKPAAVAVDGPRGRIMAISVEDGRLHVLDLSGREQAAHGLGGAPFGLAVDPASGHALVTDWGGALREIDPADGRALRRWATGATPSGVAAGRGVIVTADRDADSVTIIRPGGVVRVAVGHHPFGVTLRGGRAFVTNVLSDSVSVIDLEADRVVATIATGERPYAVAFAAGRGFVTNQYDASVTVFDEASLSVLGRIETDEYPEGIAATADGNRILVANWFSDTVQAIDAAGMAVVETLDMPEGPRAFGQFIGRP